MPLSRRTLLQAGAASGALLLARPLGALAQTLGPAEEFATSRQSRLFPDQRLVHADLHNHTLLSDGRGRAEDAFASMRSAGLDVAAITDHSTVSWGLPGSACGGDSDCQSVAGIDEESWARLRELADAADDPGAFVAIRGFEWSSPSLGHVNVWFSERWIDPLHTAAVTTGQEPMNLLHDEDPFPTAAVWPQLEAAIVASGVPESGLTMRGLYEWLQLPHDTPVLGGGLDGISGFNHPGREADRFSAFAFEPALRDRMVSIEAFNRGEDYLFERVDEGQPSPISQCLDNGWRVGTIGVSDEHGTDWGYPDGKGRTGVYVTSLDRAGVRAGMEARRVFATRLRGLRLDASANGVPMGGAVRHPAGVVRFALDIDRGHAWWGKRLGVQVLRPGGAMPAVVHAEDVTVPSEREPVLRFQVPVDASDGGWLLLRVTDPETAADGRAPAPYDGFGGAIAYASPWFLSP